MRGCDAGGSPTRRGHHGREAAPLRLGQRLPAGNGPWFPTTAANTGIRSSLAREMMEAFLKAPASATARDAEHQNQEQIVYVEVDDPLVTVNVNTPEEFAALQRAAPLLRD